MTVSQNQLVREIELLSRINVVIAGNPAGRYDVDQFRSVCILRYGLELDLLQLASIDASSFRRECLSLTKIDIPAYFEDVKLLKKELISTMQLAPGSRPWRRFKHDVAGELHYNVLLPTLAKLWDSPKNAYQWVCFDERACFQGIDSDEESKYVAWEESLAAFSYPESTVEELNSILIEWFSDFSFATSTVCPKFGPGATASLRRGTPVLEKLVDCQPEKSVADALGEWYYHDPSVLFVREGISNAPRTNKIYFVPKNALRKRVISAEPTWLTWGQQLLKQSLFPYVSEHRRMFTTFEDQGPSKEAARRGSVDASMATIDFSSASDSITESLVASLFKGTCLQEPLLITRSTTAELPSGRVIALKKFAPMGSATCFFVLDTVVLAMCELATRQALGRKGKPGDYVVYGDDACIRSDIVQEFLAVSQDLHMTVNEGKSYWSKTDRLFRESCGGEYLDGVDITPLRYSRFQEPLVGASSDPSGDSFIPAVVSLCNRAFTAYGFWNLRKMAYACLQHACARRRETATIPSRLLRVDYSDWVRGYDGPLALVTQDGTATNYNARARWNPMLQRREVEVYHFSGRYAWNPEVDGDDLAYTYWFHAKRISAAAEDSSSIVHDDPMQAVAGTVRQKWRKVWFGW